MKQLLPLLVIVLFSSGCSQKSEFQTLINDRVYTNAIGYTKSVTLKQNDISVAVATFTYINPLYKDLYNDAEYFIIGLHFEGENVLSADGLNFTMYNPQSLQFSAHEEVLDFYANPIEIDSVDTNEFVDLPLRNSWSSYYLVKFEKTQSNTLKLKFGSDALGYENFTIVKDRQKV